MLWDKIIPSQHIMDQLHKKLTFIKTRYPKFYFIFHRPASYVPSKMIVFDLVLLQVLSFYTLRQSCALANSSLCLKCFPFLIDQELVLLSWFRAISSKTLRLCQYCQLQCRKWYSCNKFSKQFACYTLLSHALLMDLHTGNINMTELL